MKLQNILINCLLVFLSVFVGLRLFNTLLAFQNRPRESFTGYKKNFYNNETISINHPKSFNINSKGQNTILLIGDSFGVGYKCGNLKNIAGCLNRISGKHVVNLSRKATTPAQYFKSLTTYIDDQRRINKNIYGETVNILLYSNDILIDDTACNYFNSNENINLKNSERKVLKSICSKKNSEVYLDQLYIDSSNSFWISFRNNFQFLKYLFGQEIYLLIEEIAGRVILSTGLPSLGRAGYAKTWGNETAEVKLVGNILNDIKTYCNSKKCKPIFTIFPNVEDLSTKSKLYNSYIGFQQYMLDNYQIKVFNGYEAFFQKGIKKATYSLIDVHSNCKGYEIYANWLLNLN